MNDRDLIKKATVEVEKTWTRQTGSARDLPAFYNPDSSISLKTPDKPLSAGGSKLSLFQVALALNLDPPYRYSQEYFWIEVLAGSPETASEIVFDWYQKQDLLNFEITGIVKSARPHNLEVETTKGSLKVAWGIPVEKNTPPGTMVRHPATGIRVGFVANGADSLIVPEKDRSDLILINKKPAPGADPVVLAPSVVFLPKNSKTD